MGGTHSGTSGPPGSKRSLRGRADGQQAGSFQDLSEQRDANLMTIDEFVGSSFKAVVPGTGQESKIYDSKDMLYMEWSANSIQAAGMSITSIPAFRQVCSTVVAGIARAVLDPSWLAVHGDPAWYCKAPAVLFFSGHHAEARRVLELCGAFVASGGRNSCCHEHAKVYPQAAWMWICWAACLLKDTSLAETCLKRISKFSHELTRTGLAHEAYASATDYEADFLATAMVCKASMECGRNVMAAESADSMMRAIVANRKNMGEGKFRLRWRFEQGFTEDMDSFHVVSQDLNDQNYFMLGFPAVVLMEVADRTGSEAYRGAALKLLEFLKGCAGLLTSPSAHVVAYLAALAGDEDLATVISLQSAAPRISAFGAGVLPEHPGLMDQAAETMTWLYLSERLARPKMHIDVENR